jgi:hypothetical protein
VIAKSGSVHPAAAVSVGIGVEIPGITGVISGVVGFLLGLQPIFNTYKQTRTKDIIAAVFLI